MRFIRRLLAEEEEPAKVVHLAGLHQAIPRGRENFVPAWSYHLGPYRDAGRMLQYWGAFCNALQQPDGGDALLLLHSYLLSFEPLYGQWHRNLEPGQLLGTDVGKQVFLTIPRVGGAGEAHWLDRYVVAVRESLSRMEATLDRHSWDEAQEPLTLLYSLYVLALSPHNLDAVARCGLIAPVVDVLEAATSAMRDICEMEPSKRPLADDWPGYCCVIAGVALRIFGCFYAPLHCWQRTWYASADERHALSLATHFGRGARRCFLLESPLVAVARAWLVLSAEHSDVCKDMIRLRLVVLEAIGSLGGDAGDLSTVARDTRLLEPLVSLLRWPAEVDDAPPNEHLQLQIGTIRCVAMCVEGSPDGGTRLAQVGFVQGVLDSLLWASQELVAAPATDGSPEKEPQQVDSARAEKVYVSVDEARASLALSPRSLPVPLVPTVLFNAGIGQLFGALHAIVFGRVTGGVVFNSELVTYLFDLFNTDVRQTAQNTRARAALCVRDDAVPLQAHLVALLIECLQRSPASLDIMRKACLWQALFSGEFFFPPRDAKGGRRILQECVWALLEHAGTCDVNDNAPEVVCCFRVLKNATCRPAQVERACCALQKMFERNPGATQAAVCDLEAIGEALGRLGFSKIGTQGAVASLMRVLALSCTITKVRTNIVTNPSGAEILLQLLWADSSHPLALDCLLTAMEEPFGDIGVAPFAILYQHYVGILQRAGDSPLLLPLLGGLRRTLVRKAGAVKAWRRAGVFSSLIGLLGPGSNSSDRCCAVLETLGALLSRSGAARAQFEREFGYDTLGKLLHARLEDPDSLKLRGQLLPLLLMLICEKEGQVSNAQALRVLLALWPHVDGKVRLDMARSALALVQASVCNAAALSGVGLCGQVIPLIAGAWAEGGELPVVLSSLLSSLATFSLVPAECFSMIALLRESGKSHPWWGSVLSVLRSAVKPRPPCPRFYWCFLGGRAALALPTFAWPRAGCAWAGWICADGGDGVLFECVGPGGSVTLVLRDWQVVYRAGGEEATLGALPKGEWCHLAVSHRSAGLLVGRSEVRLFVDGAVSPRDCVISYPVLGTLEFCMVGNDVRRRAGYHGRLGVFYLFGEGLSASQVVALHALGPRYIGPLDGDIVRPSAVIASFSSESRNGKALLETRSQGQGVVLPGVLSARGVSVLDSLHSLGGLRMLLPVGIVLARESRPDPAHVQTWLELLADAARGGDYAQHDLARCRALSVINHVLRALPPSCASPNLAESLLVRLRASLVLPALVEHYLVEIVPLWEFWARATPESQKHFLLLLRERFFGTNSSRAPVALSVQSLLDSLRFYEWDAGARVILWQCIGDIVASGIVESQSIALLQYALGGEGALECLLFVLNTLSPANCGLFLAHSSIGGGLVDVFVTFLSNSSAPVRVAALALFARLPLQDSPEFLERVAGVLQRALSVWPLTLSIASIIMSLLVDRRALPFSSFQNLDVAESTGMPPQLLVDSPLVKFSQALPLFLGLLPRATLSLRHALLHDLCSVLLGAGENLDCVTRLSDWQLRLLRVVADTRRDGEGEPEGVAIGVQVQELMRNVFLRAFRTDPRAWQYVQHTVALVGVMGAELPFTSTCHSLLSSIAVQLEQEARAVRSRTASQAIVSEWERRRGNVIIPNIARFALVVEDFLYYSLPNDVQQCVAECLAARAAGMRAVPLVSLPPATVSLQRRSRTPSTSVRLGGESARWQDESLAVATLELLATTGLHSEGTWPSNADPGGRRGDGKRLSLRLATDLLRFSRSRPLLEKTAVYLWGTFGKWTPSPSVSRGAEAPPAEPLYVLGMTLATLRQRGEEGAALLPLLRQLLRSVWPVVCARRRHQSLPVPNELELEEARADLGERNLDVAAFLAVLDKPHWKGLVETVQGIVGAHLGADAAFWQSIRQQTLDSLDDALDAVDRAVAAGAVAENEFSERTLECDRRRLQGERKRIEAALLVREQRREKCASRAAVLMRELERPGSPWAPKGAGERDHWKRDSFETPERLRPRLKLNRRFDSHEDKCSVLFKPEISERNVLELSMELKAAVAAAARRQEESVVKEEDDKQSGGEDHDGGGEEIDDGAEDEDEGMRRRRALLGSDRRSFSVVMDESFVPFLPSGEYTVFEGLCAFVKPLMNIEGSVRLTNMAIYFESAVTGGKKRRWLVGEIREVHLRRFLLRNSAVEIFHLHQRPVLFNFPGNERDLFHQKLVGLHPPRLESRERGAPEAIFKASTVTEAWREHRISNLEYLMWLNTVAGRTYNDLGQYPVFPWVLSCYNDPTVHLGDPSCYRDLSKPVGALNPDRLSSFLQRYRQFVDPEIPAFMYGSHYSNAGIVLYYAVRMEPFTSYHLQLQGGKFDQADRMFHSVPRTWVNVLTHTSDVKELIPEWYYQPEMFCNTNRFQLGYRQNGELIDNVELPAWCSSAEEFVRINRAALESDYVSENLHHWIDLIFGYKQRGEAARDAFNVFFHLTYSGSVDMDAITDLHQRRAVEEQVRHFGQMPAQLTRIPHPARKPRTRRPGGMLGAGLSIGSADLWVVGRPTKFAIHVVPFVTDVEMVSVAVILSSVGRNGSRFVTVDARRIPATHRWVADVSSLEGEGGAVANFQLETDPQPNSRPPVGPPLSQGAQWSWRCMCFADEGRLIVTGGHFDQSVVVSSLAEVGLVVQRLWWHRDCVTALAIDASEEVLVSGSRDATLAVWPTAMLPSSGRLRFASHPVHELFGHTSEVVSVAVRMSFDLVVSGGADGTVLVHELGRGRLLRRLVPAAGAVGFVDITNRGSILVYSAHALLLSLYSLNGALLVQQDSQEHILCGRVSCNGEFLITCTQEASVTIRQLHSLQVLHKLRCSAPMTCLDWTPDESNIIGCTTAGQIVVISALLPTRKVDVASPRSSSRTSKQ